jgi:hypothetical protein
MSAIEEGGVGRGRGRFNLSLYKKKQNFYSLKAYPVKI